MDMNDLIVFGIAGAVLVVGILWGMRRASAHRLPTSVTALPSDVVELAGPEIARLVAEGQKIQAIKRVRELTGISLKEAKDYVDQLASGRGQPLPSPKRAVDPVVMDPALVDMYVRPSLAQGNVIEAIRQVRLHTGMGLKEAKEYVDRLRSEDHNVV